MSQQEIQKYIQEQNAKDTSKSEIAKGLIAQGYSVEDINTAFNALESGIAPEQPTAPSPVPPEPKEQSESAVSADTTSSTPTAGESMPASEPMQLKQKPPHATPTAPQSSVEKKDEPHAYSIPQQNMSQQSDNVTQQSTSPQEEPQGIPLHGNTQQSEKKSGGNGLVKAIIGTVVVIVLLVAAAIGLHAAEIIELPFDVPFVTQNTDNEPSSEQTDEVVTEVGDKTKSIQEERTSREPLSLSIRIDQLTTAHNTFGFAVLEKLYQESRDENIVISPTSISMALSMAFIGASPAVQQEMSQVLALDNQMSTDVLSNTSSELLAYLSRNTDVQLRMAQSMWARENPVINPQINPVFSTMIRDYFNADVTALDFSDSSAPVTINDWVATATNNTITSIVPDIIDSGVALYLINAVYFNGSWTTAFDVDMTESRTFVTATGESIEHPFMMRDGMMSYLETDAFQSVQLPYGEDESISMYVFLPEDMTTFVQTLESETFEVWNTQYTQSEVALYIPKFILEYDIDLIQTLQQLGMNLAFETGDRFSSIRENLHISGVQHKTFIDVDEEGTEAAAATLVEMAATASLEQPTFFTMDVSRPFVIVIRDDTTNENIFIGSISDPRGK